MSLMETFADYGLKTLKHWAIQRQVPLLFERSLRLQAQVAENQRALFSFPVEALRSGSLNEVLQICEAMSSPISHRSAIERFLPQAGFVHFGFERSGKTLIGKCYLELPNVTAPLQTGIPQPSRLTFIGYKWSMNDHSTAVVSRYESVSVATWEELSSPIVLSVPALWQDCVRELVNVFQPAADGNPFVEYRLLQVTEEGSQRKSFDLNVYCRDVVGKQISGPLTTLCEALDVDVSTVTDWLQQYSNAHIGHLAAGVNRMKQPFVTVYHSADLNSV